MGVKEILFWTLLLPSIGALQQHPASNDYKSSAPYHRHPDAVSHRWRNVGADSLDPEVSGRPNTANTDNQKVRTHRTRSPTDERALATTLSPAEKYPAVRAAPAPGSSSATGDLSSRQPARSLQDWQVEDIILLATVDGNIHARDRRTGAPRWELEADRPMVETVYHRHNRSVDEHGSEVEDPLWIVEPSQDGSIYVYIPGSPLGMQRLGKTVKELAELAPYASDEPAVAYTAEKKNTLYTVDASTGHVLKSFSSAGTHFNQDRSCRRVHPLEALEEDECEPIGTLTLGRTEYTIGVQDRRTGERISTIKYCEWGPNNRDQDLRSKYTKSMDSKYVYTKFDGTVFGLDLGSKNEYHDALASKPIYRQKLSTPVARIYDLVRSNEDVSGDANLVMLPQPPSPHVRDVLDHIYRGSVFVNCTPDGSFYALSESNYPAVTEGATTARCYSDDLSDTPAVSWPLSKPERERFTGIHPLSNLNEKQTYGTHLIESQDRPLIDPPPALDPDDTKEMKDSLTSDWNNVPYFRSVLATVLFGLVVCGVIFRQQLGLELPRRPQDDAAGLPTHPDSKIEEPQMMVREVEPAEETIFPPQDSPLSMAALPNEPPTDAAGMERVTPDEEPPTGDNKDKEAEPKKKKATRGKRGGRKQKEKEAQQAEAQAKRKLSQVPQPAEVISVADSESPQVSGPLQINSLIIHTDKVIGQGSCGTSVFEGSFEGRAVAVKRMLSQYYELASQEVSFLQQSDDHPNVIRYFCQQRDDHFLYIAVELCQASVFEVWEPEKARTEARQQQLRELKLAIQRDVPRTLHQLAAGLYHLHDLRIIHRDIKPQNILVAFPKTNQTTARLVISDFGLGKNLPENASTLVDPTGNAGTSGWKAPELISQPLDSEASRNSQQNSYIGGSENVTNGTASGVKRAADIFSLGCLYFWVLTDGVHPYEDENGWHQLRELNIKKDNKTMGVLERWSDAYEPMQLITSMLQHQPQDRPTALQVLHHPFFWPPEKRLAFLCDSSDHFERESRGTYEDYYAGDSYHLQLLESKAEDVIGAPFERADFLSKLDR